MNSGEINEFMTKKTLLPCVPIYVNSLMYQLNMGKG